MQKTSGKIHTNINTPQQSNLHSEGVQRGIMITDRGNVRVNMKKDMLQSNLQTELAPQESGYKTQEVMSRVDTLG